MIKEYILEDKFEKEERLSKWVRIDVLVENIVRNIYRYRRIKEESE